MRIYPALIVIILVAVFIVGPFFTNLKDWDYFRIPTTWLYLLTVSGLHIKYILPGVFTSDLHFDHGINGSLWSIALELKLYILLIGFGLVNKRRKLWGNVMPMVLALVLAFFVNENILFLASYFDALHCRLMAIFFMGYTANAYHDRLQLSWIWLVVISLIYFVSMRYVTSARFITETMFFGYATLFISYRVKLFKPDMDISYGVYLYSFLITQIIIEVLRINNPLYLIMVVGIVVLPLSILSWLFIEKKALAHK